jgi:TonB family protein
MDQSGNKKYNVNDIERYHAGQMSAAEMHALEKAAMNDPFLADALEGYRFTKTSQDDLDQIKKRLAEKSDRRKVVPLFSKTWVQIAAVILVLGVGGWLLISPNQTDNQNIASVPAEKILRKADSSDVAKGVDKVTTTNSDTISIADDKTISPSQDIVASAGQSHKNKDHQLNPPGLIRKEEIVSKEVNQQNQAADSSLKKQYAFSNAAPASNNDVARQPASKKAEMFYRDTQASDKKDANQKVAGVRVNDTLKNLNVTMKPIPESVSEVVVSGSQAKTSRSKEYNYSNVVVDTLEPTGGWVKYDDYVANNIKIPEEVQQKEISGVVQLSFDVDKNGEATNIKVEKSLCDRCDQEAIRLLKEGPKWTKKKNKKGKLTLRF